MSITGRDIHIQELYREEMRYQAERWHILQNYGGKTNRVRMAYRWAMLKMGEGLEAAGCWLKARYASSQVESALASSPEGGLQSC